MASRAQASLTERELGGICQSASLLHPYHSTAFHSVHNYFSPAVTDSGSIRVRRGLQSGITVEVKRKPLGCKEEE